MELGKVLLEVKGLQKRYGEKVVVEDIHFTLQAGEIMGFLGPNGAGKSTTIKMLTGILSKDRGEIRYNGKSCEELGRSFQQKIGVVPQEIAVYSDLSAYDNVKFFCSLYGIRGAKLERQVKEALTFVGLWERRKEKPGKFSGGMKRRLNIACSIAHKPELLIMDEPTVGIDPQSRNHIMEAIKNLNEQGTTVIYVSHYMEEIEALCNPILIADKGKVIVNMTKDELNEKYMEDNVDNLEGIFLRITGTRLRDEEE